MQRLPAPHERNLGEYCLETAYFKNDGNSFLGCLTHGKQRLIFPPRTKWISWFTT
ncbi:MAG: hypothetical protein ACFE8J_08745 [Candidatus Heimdallarchaeota archaeon]